MRFLLCFVLLLSSLFSQGQDPSVLQLDLRDPARAYWYEARLLNNGVLNLPKLPGELHIILSNDEFASFRLMLDSTGKTKGSTLAFSCDDSTCTKLLLADIVNNTLVLHFSEGRLTGIGNRLLPSPIAVPITKNGVSLKLGQPGPAVAPGKAGKNNSSRETTLCDRLFTARQKTIPLDSLRKRYDFLCRRPDTTAGRRNCAPLEGSRFNYAFLPPCNDPQGNALTARYHVIYDFNKKPEPLTYLEIKKKNGVEYYKVLKTLHPRANAELIVTVVGDKDTGYQVTTSGTQNFMEDEARFAGALEALGKPKKDKPATNETQSQEKLEAKDSSIQKAQLYKGQLTDLQQDLITFNAMYPSIDLVEKSYRAELRCLQENIAAIFDIAVPATGAELATDLSKKIDDQVIDSSYYQDLCSLIRDIGLRYEEAVSKKPRYYPKSESVQVTNTDEFKIAVATTKGTPVFERTFNVKGGFKIDFSTGFFVSGLSSGDFILSNERFRYKSTRDTVLPTGRDSLIYNGNIGDTAYTVIRQNRNNSFGTGVYVHFYPRLGGWLDVGGSAGIILDNNAQVQLLFGASLLFKAGKNRVGLVFGLTRGREKALSKENEQYFVSETRALYESSRELPRPFTGSNPVTYDRWRTSCFVGLTFNFASVTIGK